MRLYTGNRRGANERRGFFLPLPEWVFPLGDKCRFAVLSCPYVGLYLCITKDRHPEVEKKGPIGLTCAL